MTRASLWAIVVLAGPPMATAEGPANEFLVRAAHLQALRLFQWSAISYWGEGNRQNPVVIQGSRSNAARTEALWRWVRSEWPDHVVMSQRLVKQADQWLDVLEIQASGSSGTTNVYFDVTDPTPLQDARGEWEFVDASGDTLKGTVEVGDYDGQHPSKAWAEDIRNRTGFIRYQIEDSFCEGVIAAGPIVDGRADGEWEAFRRSFGLSASSYVAGAQHGRERLWNASGELRAEFLYEEGALKQIWDWGSGTGSEMDLDNLRRLTE